MKPKDFGVEKHDLFNERDKDTSFYTAYAKDVFIAMLEKHTSEAIQIDKVMEDSINIIKQARDAFSQ